MLRVASFGDLVLDVLAGLPALPVEAAKDQLLDYMRVEPGGAGNFLIAGQRLGMEMRAGGAVGNDAFGGLILDILREEGIDVSAVQVLPDGSTTTVLVLVDRHGNHVFLGKSIEGQKLDAGPWMDALLDAVNALQVWGYTFLEAPLVDAMVALVEKAHRRGIPVFFDPGPQLRTDSELLARFVGHLHGVFLTEAEIPLLTHGQMGCEGVRRILSQGPNIVIVKQGVKGCTLYTHNETVVSPGFSVPLRDTTAAGDSFAAAFLYGYLQGWPLDRVATLANAMGAAKVQKVGSGRQVPTRDDVLRVLRQFKVEILI